MSKTTALEKLPSSLKGNRYAVDLAKKYDRQSTTLATVKAERDETKDRPGRARRAMATSIGAALGGAVAGAAESTGVKIGIAMGLGVLGVGAGIAMDSDDVFDAGMGPLYGATFLAAGAGAGKLKEKVMAAVSSDESSTDAPADTPDTDTQG